MAKNKFPNANNNSTLQKIIRGELLFFDREKVRRYLDIFKQSYEISEKYNEWGEDNFVLWIHDFELGEEEIKSGYLGNYAHVYIAERDGNLTVKLEKLFIPLSNHPRQNRPLQPNPNSGEPILREIEKKIPYKTFEEAFELLKRLAEKYPKACIMKLPEKVIVNIYSRNKETGKVALVSHVIRVVEQDELFYLDKQVNKRVDIHFNKKVDEFVYSAVQRHLFHTPLPEVTNEEEPDNEVEAYEEEPAASLVPDQPEIQP